MFVKISLMGLLLVSTAAADWSERFSTILDALLYPVTRHLSEEDSNSPSAKTDRFEKIHSRIEQFFANQLKGREAAQAYLQALAEAEAEAPQSAWLMHQEMGNRLTNKLDVPGMTYALDSLQDADFETFRIRWDLARRLLNEQPQHPRALALMEELKDPPVERKTLGFQQAQASMLIFQGKFKKALAILQPLQTDSEKVPDYWIATFEVALMNDDTRLAAKALKQLSAFFEPELLHALEARLQFQRQDYYAVTQLYESRPQLDIQPRILALAYLLNGAGEQAQPHAEKAGFDLQGFQPLQSPLLSRLAGIHYLNEDPASQLKALPSASKQLSSVPTAMPKGPARTWLEDQLQQKPQPSARESIRHAMADILDFAGPASRLASTLKQAQQKLEELRVPPALHAAHLMEIPFLNTRSGAEAALNLDFVQSPKRKELRARLHWFQPQAEEPEWAQLSPNPDDSEKLARALYLSRREMSSKALEILNTLSKPTRHWLWYTTSLELAIDQKDASKALTIAESMLAKYPESISEKLVLKALFLNGRFATIVKAPLKDNQDAQIQEIRILSALFASRLNKAREWLQSSDLQYTLLPPDQAQDPIAVTLLQLSHYEALSPKAKTLWAESLGDTLQPSTAAAILQTLEGNAAPLVLETLKNRSRQRPSPKSLKSTEAFAQGYFSHAIQPLPLQKTNPAELEVQILSRIYSSQTTEALKLSQDYEVPFEWPPLEFDGESFQTLLFQHSLQESLSVTAYEVWLQQVATTTSATDAKSLLQLPSVQADRQFKKALQSALEIQRN